METEKISKEVPVGTPLYRYDLKKNMPKTWTTDYHNIQYIFDRGCKNIGGFFFFYENEQTAIDALRIANKNVKSPANTITSCNTTREVVLLDLSLFGTPSQLLAILYKNGIDVFNKGFRRYGYNQSEDLMLDSIRESFIKMIAINTCSKKCMETAIKLSKQIDDFFYSSKIPDQEWQYIGQFFTDFENGPIFKQILSSNGYDGYCFKEAPTSLTYCLFGATALSAPTHKIVNFLSDNVEFDEKR